MLIQRNKKEIIKSIRLHINLLQKKHREVLIKRFWENRSLKEIALLIQESEEKTSLILNEALAEMKQRIEKETKLDFHNNDLFKQELGYLNLAVAI